MLHEAMKQKPEDYRPLGQNLLVKVHVEMVTEGGIALPPGSEDMPRFHPIIGEVLKAGKGVYTHTGELLPCECEVGDTVLFIEERSALLKFHKHKDKFYSVPETSVLGKFVGGVRSE